jgi:hypothetical protein
MGTVPSVMNVQAAHPFTPGTPPPILIEDLPRVYSVDLLHQAFQRQPIYLAACLSDQFFPVESAEADPVAMAGQCTNLVTRESLRPFLCHGHGNLVLN